MLPLLSHLRKSARSRAPFLFVLLFRLSAPGAVEAAGPPKGWDVLEGCRLIDSSGNDGDSFHVRHQQDEFTIRLYFVDAPEKEAEFPARLKAQAAYFGAEVDEMVPRGLEATAFTRQFLAGEFTLYSQWEDGMGRGKRYLAVVERDGEFLAEALVAAGLARIYGFEPKTIWPGGGSLERVKERLETAEREAHRERRGCWSGTSTPAIVTNEDSAAPDGEAAPPQPLMALPRLVTVLPTDPDAGEGAPSPSASADLLDLNTATLAELRRLPGVGEVYASAIVAGRPWARVEDLTRIPGIGPAALARIEPFVRVSVMALVVSEAPTEPAGRSVFESMKERAIPVVPQSASFYRQDPERWREQMVEVSVRRIDRLQRPAPEGFVAVEADTGSRLRSGGKMLLYLPAERLEDAVEAFQRATDPIVLQVVFHYMNDEDVLVMPRR